MHYTKKSIIIDMYTNIYQIFIHVLYDWVSNEYHHDQFEDELLYGVTLLF